MCPLWFSVRPACSRALRVFCVVCVSRSGRGYLAPGQLPWLWPAACLSGVPRGPAFVRRASSGPFALGAPVKLSVALVPSPSRGSRPWIYWAGARGMWRLAKNLAHGACRWPSPRRGRWCRSASHPLGAPLWGCPWRVPPATVSGCVRYGGFGQC